VFENRVLSRTFGPKRDEMAGGWRRLCNEEFHKLYALPNIQVIRSRRMRWVEQVAQMGEMRNAYNILVGKAEGKRLLRRPRHRWEGDIRMELRETEWEGLDWMHLAQALALVNMVMNLQVP
jgi:hypothetical protein